MKHQIPIMIAFTIIVVAVFSFALNKKEKYYDYETSAIIPKIPAWDDNSCSKP